MFREELSDEALLVLVLDTREQLCPQLGNCFWFIERQLLIHLAALKVTRLAARLEYRSDVRGEGDAANVIETHEHAGKFKEP
jgi:hypothetical protein